jgi:tetratricopeptide (TPR) repeat protein
MCGPFRKLSLFLISILAFGLLLSSATFAQNRGFAGRIINDKGEPVANAKIKIIGQSSKREYTTNSDKRGQWVYMNLPPGGAYWVVVRADGYNPAVKQSEATAGMTALDFQLSPGDPNQKFPFEMTAAEQEKMKQDQAQAKEQAKVYGEIKASFEAARALVDQGKYDEAIVEFKKALEKAPNEPTVWANLADAQMKAGQGNDAMESYQKALALRPDDSSLWINYGTVLNNLGKTTESKDAFKKAAELNPGAKAQSYYNLGVTQMNAMQTQDAVASFRQAIEADANYAEAYFRLGQCLLSDQATIPEAIKDLEKYIQIGKDSTNIQTAKDIVAALKK